MEEASKAIDIAVGVIIFMIALSVNVVLYVSINKAVQEVLSINDTQSNVIVSDEEINNTYVEYSSSEIFFMVQDMILATDESGNQYISDEYTPYKDINSNNVSWSICSSTLGTDILTCGYTSFVVVVNTSVWNAVTKSISLKYSLYPGLSLKSSNFN